MNKIYKSLSKQFLQEYKNNGNYRIFRSIQKKEPPYGLFNDSSKIIWCSNDYNNLSQNDNIKKIAIDSINKYGVGSGGTRNIGGTWQNHIDLENRLSKFHDRDSSLIFTSGYLANYSTISAFGKIFPNASIFSDSNNHASIIYGIQSSKLKKHIFKHNDLDDLEKKLKKSNSKQKIIIFESIYSTDGSISNINQMVYLAKKYNCITYIDEIHAIGIYGKKGAGLTELYNCNKEIDIIMGGFGKGIGTIGGYISGDTNIIDSIRCSASGLIFSTSLPPHISQTTIASIDYINTIESYNERNLIIENTNYFKNKLLESNIEFIDTNPYNNHIIAIKINDPFLCFEISNLLFNQYNHYVQPINYPTVKKGEEIFRITINIYHTKTMIDDFIKCLNILINKYKI
jgi:5-aminolevulinate synthase